MNDSNVVSPVAGIPVKEEKLSIKFCIALIMRGMEKPKERSVTRQLVYESLAGEFNN